MQNGLSGRLKTMRPRDSKSTAEWSREIFDLGIWSKQLGPFKSTWTHDTSSVNA